MNKEPLYLTFHKGVITQINYLKLTQIALFAFLLLSFGLNYYFFDKLSEEAKKETRLIDKDGRVWQVRSFLTDDEADFLEARDFARNFVLHFYTFSKENFDYNMGVATKDWGSKSVQYVFDMNKQKKVYDQVLEQNFFAYVDEKELLQSLKVVVGDRLSFTATFKMLIKGDNGKYLDFAVSGDINRIPKGVNNPHGMSVVNFEQQILN